MDYVPGEDHTIDRPADYAFWRDYVPAMTPAWPGRLLSWQMSDPQTLRTRAGHVRSDRAPAAAGSTCSSTGGIADPANFEPGTYAGGISLVNWPQNDYWLGPLLGVPAQDAARHLERGKAAEPVAPLLDADRGAAGRRRRRLEGPAAAR